MTYAQGLRGCLSIKKVDVDVRIQHSIVRVCPSFFSLTFIYKIKKLMYMYIDINILVHYSILAYIPTVTSYYGSYELLTNIII